MWPRIFKRALHSHLRRQEDVRDERVEERDGGGLSRFWPHRSLRAICVEMIGILANARLRARVTIRQLRVECADGELEDE